MFYSGSDNSHATRRIPFLNPSPSGLSFLVQLLFLVLLDVDFFFAWTKFLCFSYMDMVVHTVDVGTI
jgi:hypothetical protein